MDSLPRTVQRLWLVERGLASGEDRPIGDHHRPRAVLSGKRIVRMIEHHHSQPVPVFFLQARLVSHQAGILPPEHHNR